MIKFLLIGFVLIVIVVLVLNSLIKKDNLNRLFNTELIWSCKELLKSIKQAGLNIDLFDRDKYITSANNLVKVEFYFEIDKINQYLNDKVNMTMLGKIVFVSDKPKNEDKWDDIK